MLFFYCNKILLASTNWPVFDVILKLFLYSFSPPYYRCCYPCFVFNIFVDIYKKNEEKNVNSMSYFCNKKIIRHIFLLITLFCPRWWSQWCFNDSNSWHWCRNFWTGTEISFNKKYKQLEKETIHKKNSSMSGINFI